MAKNNKKLENAILYLLKRSSSHRPPLTVLLKMLWYVDYSHYSEFLSSVTGARYLAMKRGPVVDGYKQILDRMERDGLLSQDKITTDRFPDSPTQYYAAVAAPDVSMFTESELDVMEEVIKVCAHQTGRDLSNRTHEPRAPWTLAWDERTPSKPIPEILWRWSENLPDATDLALAHEDVSRPHVVESLKKLRAGSNSAKGAKRATPA